MSLILDALNKAQREREEKRDPVPQLSTVHYAPPPPKINGRRRALAAIALLVITAAIFALWLMPDREMAIGPAPENSPAVSRLAQPSAPSTEPSPAPAPAETAVAEPAPASEQNIVSLYNAARRGVERTAAEDALEEDSPAAEAVPEPAAERESAPQAPPAEPEQPATQPFNAAPPEADTLAAHPEIPYVQELSWAVQQELPSLSYSRHQYHPNPANRSVELNGSAYRTGSQVAQGLRLEQILSDGIILTYQSRRFKLEALNSWVNF